MKRGLGAGALLLVLGVAAYLFFGLKSPAPTMVAPTASRNRNQSERQFSRNACRFIRRRGDEFAEYEFPQYQGQPVNLAARAGQAVPDSSPPADLPPEKVLENVRRAIHEYGETFGGNPVGTNPEITSQLSGDNPKHVNFISAQAGMRLNAEGELIDAWGTPYFFHQISGEETEVHSAGPDRVMWTSDDLVVK